MKHADKYASNTGINSPNRNFISSNLTIKKNNNAHIIKSRTFFKTQSKYGSKYIGYTLFSNNNT